MIILGLNMGHDGSACVVRDGRLVAALARERLTRVKKQSGVDATLIRTVLAQAGAELKDVDYIAFGAYHHGPSSDVRIREVGSSEVVTRDLQHDLGEYRREYICEIEGREIRAVYVQHQLAHCAAAYYTSPFESAGCLSMDASLVNPEYCSLYAIGTGLDLEPLYCPGLMIGNAYHSFTEKIGLGNGLFKAGSMMGLAAYGKPIRHPLHEEFLKNFFERRIKIDPEFIGWIWSLLSDLPPQTHLSLLDQKAMDLAATVQLIFEETTLAAAQRLHTELARLHGNNLVLAGGSFLNCNANTRILQESGFSALHLFPACGDDGTAVGAALYVAHHLLRLPRTHYGPKDLAYLGPDHALPTEGSVLDLARVAEEIAQGKVVGWFQGRSEFGPRALGNRSILADPRSPHMRDYLNSEVKHREWFRPFAPVVIAEESNIWFDFEHETPFMLHTARVKRPEIIPAVSHVDATARIQTVTEVDNPLLYDLLTQFKKRTGVPMLLNTSFNLGGEPLVESPSDALDLFRRSKLDILVLGEKLFGK